MLMNRKDSTLILLLALIVLICTQPGSCMEFSHIAICIGKDASDVELRTAALLKDRLQETGGVQAQIFIEDTMGITGARGSAMDSLWPAGAQPKTFGFHGQASHQALMCVGSGA